jgi:hypothetical protein
MNSTFWNRYIAIEVGDVVITSEQLDIEFVVENSTGEEAGSAEITIYNLAETTKQKLKPSERITLKAGYAEDYGIIFSGVIKEVVDELKGADVATQIFAQDDTANLLTTEVKLTVPRGTTFEEVVEKLFEFAGVPVGRVEHIGLKFTQTWTSGKKSISELLSYLAKEIEELSGKRFKHYVKNGMGFFVEENTRHEEAFILTAETGLLEVQKIRKENGEADYRLRTLMLWKIMQDSIIDLDSIKATGLFRVVSYRKIARGEEYYCELEVKAV